MKIGVNLLWLVPGDVGGSESWVRGLLGTVAADPPPGVDVVVFASPALLAAHPYLSAFRTVEAPAAIGGSRPRRIVAESTWLAAAARRAGVDVLHHAGGTVPALRASPAMVTIHDLQPLALPEHFSRKKLAYLRARLRPSVRASELVTAVSRFAADDVTARLGADPARVVVTPPAVDAEPPPSASGNDSWRGALRLDGPWFLYPAVTWPHKNHALLIDAFARVLAARPDARLVLTGAAGPAETDVLARVERVGVGHALRRPGRVDDGLLDALFRGAAALTFPSLYEAVGIPVLEAMARSCPVLAADVPGLADTVGAAGELLPPDDPAAWAIAMERSLAGPDPALIASGRDRVRAWAPAASAAALVAAWSRAAS